MSELLCAWPASDFSAVAIYTGENRLVRVQGRGSCPQTGFSVTLEAVNPGIVPEPHRLHLGLVEKAPANGGYQITDVEIDATFDVSQEVTEVAIRGVGAIPVQEPA
ncbi:hypothetical protein [Nocardioides sp. SR21]|uniref:hypothetical protein n=1 Tax=Nocardioides sp. SR21 TaxID=2919501 RepID=UPI001FAA9995|nr:hypothetical protein [Nocardioides sp. SR21]